MKKLILCMSFLVLFAQPISAQGRFYSSRNGGMELYSVRDNRHGTVIRTSLGIFYLGNSRDAIHEVAGIKRYGYWERSNTGITVYVNGNVYLF